MKSKLAIKAHSMTFRAVYVDDRIPYNLKILLKVKRGRMVV